MSQVRPTPDPGLSPLGHIAPGGESSSVRRHSRFTLPTKVGLGPGEQTPWLLYWWRRFQNRGVLGGLGQPRGHLGDALLSWVLRRVGFRVVALGTRSCRASG